MFFAIIIIIIMGMIKTITITTTITIMLLIITMAQVEMGLTWIDHDVIEVPVEEIEVGGQRQIISYF